MERAEADTVKFTAMLLHKALFFFKVTALASFYTGRSFAKMWDVYLMIQFLKINTRCVANNIPCTYAGGGGENRQTDTHKS